MEHRRHPLTFYLSQNKTKQTPAPRSGCTFDWRRRIIHNASKTQPRTLANESSLQSGCFRNRPAASRFTRGRRVTRRFGSGAVLVYSYFYSERNSSTLQYSEIPFTTSSEVFNTCEWSSQTLWLPGRAGIRTFNLQVDEKVLNPMRMYSISVLYAAPYTIQVKGASQTAHLRSHETFTSSLPFGECRPWIETRPDLRTDIKNVP